MWRPLVPGDFARMFELFQLFLHLFDLALKAGNILLLPEYLRAELRNGVILQGKEAFKLVYSVFHAGKCNRSRRNEEWIHPLLR